MKKYWSNEMEQAFDAFLDAEEFEKHSIALMELVRAAFAAGHREGKADRSGEASEHNGEL